MKDYYTTAEVGKIIGRTNNTVRKLADQGHLPWFRSPSAGGTSRHPHRRFRASEVYKFCEKHGIPIPEDMQQMKTFLLAGGSVCEGVQTSLTFPTVFAGDVFQVATEIAKGCVFGAVIDVGEMGSGTSRQIIHRLREMGCSFVAVIVPEDCTEQFDADEQWKSPFAPGELADSIVSAILSRGHLWT